MIDWIAEGASRDPARVVWTEGGEDWTYARLDDTAGRVAAVLASAVGSGDRVAVLGASSTFHLVAAFAAWRLAAALAPLNTRLSEAETEGVLADCDPALVLHDGRYHGSREAQSFDEVLGRACAAKAFDSAARPSRPENIAFLLYTSGTTGKPKGAMLSHRMVAANVRQTVRGWGLAPEDRTLLYAPLFHTGGWNVLTLPLLAIGGHTTLLAKFDADEVAERAREGATVLFGVPTMFATLLDTGHLARGNLRFVISGGAPCPIELIDRYLDRGIEFRQGFGMTEVGPNCFFFPSEAVRAKAGTVGLPMPGTTARLDAGELVLGGPHAFSGYWRNPAETAAALSGAEVRTGDLAERDADGFFKIVGRKKEMFISGGENVYPAEVEAALGATPGVLEAAVVGVPDPKWGEVGCAFVVPESGRSLSPDSLRKELRRRIAHYKVPSHYRFLAELPRNSMGKVQKAQLALVLPSKPVSTAP